MSEFGYKLAILKLNSSKSGWENLIYLVTRKTFSRSVCFQLPRSRRIFLLFSVSIAVWSNLCELRLQDSVLGKIMTFLDYSGVWLWSLGGNFGCSNQGSWDSTFRGHKICSSSLEIYFRLSRERMQVDFNKKENKNICFISVLDVQNVQIFKSKLKA